MTKRTAQWSSPSQPPKKDAARPPLEAARSAIESGNYSEAAELLKALLEKEPGHEPARLLTAQLHLKSGSLMAAKAAFESLAQDAMRQGAFDRAEGYLREYLAAAARYVPFLELLSQACETQSKTDQAVTELGKAVAILLEFPDPDDRAHAERLYEKAKTLAPDHPEVAKITAALAPPTPPPQEAPAPESASPEAAPEPVTASSQPPVAEQTSAPEAQTESVSAPTATASPASSEVPVSEASTPQPATAPEPSPAPSETMEPAAETTSSASVSPPPAEPQPVPEVTVQAAEPAQQNSAPVASVSATTPPADSSGPVESTVRTEPAPSTNDVRSEPAGPLIRREAQVAESSARAKADQPVELISLEDWINEPLAPEPLAPVRPQQPARASSGAISLPDHSTESESRGDRGAGWTRRLKDTVVAALHGEFGRKQLETQAEAAPDSASVRDHPEPVPPSMAEQAVRPATAEPAGRPAPETDSAAAEGTRSSTKQTEPSGAGPTSQATVSPIASLDPDLKAELATFLREKTPLTDRASVFSPYAETRSEEEPPASGEAAPTAEAPSQPAHDPTMEPQVTASEPAIAPSEEIVSIQEEPVAASQPEIPLETTSAEPAWAVQDEGLPAEPQAVAPPPIAPEPDPELPVAEEAQPESVAGQSEQEATSVSLVADTQTFMLEEPPVAVAPPEAVHTEELDEPPVIAQVQEPEPSAPPPDLHEIDQPWQLAEETLLTTMAQPAYPYVERQTEVAASVEEPSRVPRAEAEETSDQINELLTVSADEEHSPDPVLEQTSEAPHRHDTHPCRLCQEAEAEEAIQQQSETPPHAERPPSRIRLPRPLRQVKRWVRAGLSVVTDTTLTATHLVVRLVLLLTTLGIGLPALGLVVITAAWLVMEQKPSAAYLELSQSPPRASEEPTRNGYYLLLGFGAGESVDPIQAGYSKWKTTREDQSRQCFGLTAGARPTIAFTAETRALALWLQAQDPVAELQRERQLVQRWAAQHGVLMSRYRTWLSLPFEDRGYGSFASPDCAQVLTAHRLYLADGFAQRTAEGLDRMEKDLIAWRHVLAHAKTMATKLLAAQAIREDVAILTAVAQRGAAESGPLPRFAHLVRPFDQVERSLRWPMQNELLLEIRRVESGLARDKEEEPSWLNRLVIRLPLPKQRTLNAHADYYEALIRAPEQGAKPPADSYTYTNSPAQDALDYLINPVDNLLLNPDHLSWQHEASVLFEADTRLRTLVASRAFQTRPAAPLTAKAVPQSSQPDDGAPTLVSEASSL